MEIFIGLLSLVVIVGCILSFALGGVIFGMVFIVLAVTIKVFKEDNDL